MSRIKKATRPTSPNKPIELTRDSVIEWAYQTGQDAISVEQAFDAAYDRVQFWEELKRRGIDARP